MSASRHDNSRAAAREARLKAALKANIARRKAQARARMRAGGADEASNTKGEEAPDRKSDNRHE